MGKTFQMKTTSQMKTTFQMKTSLKTLILKVQDLKTFLEEDSKRPLQSTTTNLIGLSVVISLTKVFANIPA